MDAWNRFSSRLATLTRHDRIDTSKKGLDKFMNVGRKGRLFGAVVSTPCCVPLAMKRECGDTGRCNAAFGLGCYIRFRGVAQCIQLGVLQPFYPLMFL